MTNSELLLHGLGYAAAYAVPVALIYAASFYLLDAVTPGHKIGERMGEGSYSAGLVSAAWMIAQSLILRTAILENGQSGLGWALLNTLAFSIVGALLLAGAFVLVDVLTPGKLSDAVCVPGRVVPLAVFTSGALLGMGYVLSACITG